MNPFGPSIEAAKAQETAAARDLLWRFRLLRTQKELIFRHAVNAGYIDRRAAADRMLALGWTWDGKARQFHVALTPENLAAVLDAWTFNGRLALYLSCGVRDLLSTESVQSVKSVKSVD